MKALWTYRVIDAPTEDVWALIADPEHWPSWGPSVRTATINADRLQRGTTGTVTTALGPQLGFEITTFEDGHRWAWKVAGIDATDHRVEALTNDRCRLGFGVPWVAAPYQVVCKVAMQRIKTLAEKTLAEKTLAEKTGVNK